MDSPRLLLFIDSQLMLRVQLAAQVPLSDAVALDLNQHRLALLEQLVHFEAQLMVLTLSLLETRLHGLHLGLL